jgi:putative addiction module killer protein
VLTFQKTETFKTWLRKLDLKTRTDILERVRLAELGHLGKLLKGTGGIREIVIDIGPGYRLYYCRAANTIYWLLIGGIKKDQKQDIERAKAIRDALLRSGYGRETN